MEVGDEIPRRWKEKWRTQERAGMQDVAKSESKTPSPMPMKNREYFDKLDTEEYGILNTNANVVPIMASNNMKSSKPAMTTGAISPKTVGNSEYGISSNPLLKSNQDMAARMRGSKGSLAKTQYPTD